MFACFRTSVMEIWLEHQVVRTLLFFSFGCMCACLICANRSLAIVSHEKSGESLALNIKGRIV